MREILATLSTRPSAQVYWAMAIMPLFIYDLFLTGLPLGAGGVIGGLI